MQLELDEWILAGIWFDYAMVSIPLELIFLNGDTNLYAKTVARRGQLWTCVPDMDSILLKR